MQAANRKPKIITDHPNILQQGFPNRDFQLLLGLAQIVTITHAYNNLQHNTCGTHYWKTAPKQEETKLQRTAF